MDFVTNHMQQFFLYLFNVELKWSECNRLAHRFDATSHCTIINKFAKFYILLNVMKFDSCLFSSIKGSITSSLLQNKTYVSNSKSQPPTRPDPTQNRRAAASAAVFPDYPYHLCNMVFHHAIISGHMVTHKIQSTFRSFFDRSSICLLVDTHRTVAQQQHRRT